MNGAGKWVQHQNNKLSYTETNKNTFKKRFKKVLKSFLTSPNCFFFSFVCSNLFSRNLRSSVIFNMSSSAMDSESSILIVSRVSKICRWMRIRFRELFVARQDPWKAQLKVMLGLSGRLILEAF